jgi:UDP-GlcNAc:undecaprenyl-phosphate GlcNAc-1-phosphate transferase
MLITLLLLSAISLLLSISLTPLVRTLAIRCNLVDQPDNKRKVHRKPIPRIGGIALTAAYFGSYIFGVNILAHFGAKTDLGFAAIRAIAPATFLIFLMGLADDIFTLKPWQKVAVQILAGILVVSSGVHVGGPFNLSGFPLFGEAVTVVWLVACTNAVNLIDGLDGLAAGIAFLVTATTFVAALVNGHTELVIATAPLAVALIGFLLFNFNPASIFLGDSGSLVLGFLLGCFSVLWSAKSTSVLDMGAPLIALSVPLLDTTLAIARRFLRNQPLFKPDRSHIHHRLLARGLSHREAVISLYVAGGMAGGFALSLMWARNQGEALILIAFVCAASFGVRQLRYAEFEAAGRILFRGGLRKEINAELAVKTFEQALSAAATPDDCWEELQRASDEFGLSILRMRLASQMFEANELDHKRSSSISISLSENDWIEIAVPQDVTKYSSVLTPFAAIMQRVLTDKGTNLDLQRKPEHAFSTALYGATPSPLIH